MQGGEDVLGDFIPNLTFDLEDLGLEALGDQAGQAASGAVYQKPVPAHRTRHEVRKGHEVPLVSKLEEHVWVLHR